MGGDILTIPQSVLNNAEELDKKINRIANDSEKMATSFNSAMTRMSGGTDGLLNKLKTIQDIVNGIGNIRVEGVTGMAQSMSATATEAEKVANGITKASVAVNQFGKSGKNIAELIAEIAALEEKLTADKGIKPFEAQQKEVNRKRELEEELKLQEKSTKEKEELVRKEYDFKRREFDKYIKERRQIQEANDKAMNSGKRVHDERHELEVMYAGMFDRINKAEEARYMNWLKLKSQETAEHQKAEGEKEKATSATIEKQLKELSELKKKVEEIRSINNRAKSNTEQKKRDFRELELMYAHMFDEIDRREKSRRKKEEAAHKAAMREAEAKIKAEERLAREKARLYATSTTGALDIANSKDTNTYTKRAVAIKNLEEAMKNLRTTDKNYQKDMDRLSAAHKRLIAEQKIVEANFNAIKTSQRKLMDTAGQLTRRFALMFSVSQVLGFLSNIRDVTGEFEKQNTALASILQNKDKADKLFGQIKELAVKSPFQLKELVSYTKQLSAYQFEYEKLFDTTKMLADVSAGLGVSMDRLILAMGQVKAANFLRGTEVRQFTEAGFNILGELAKYYSELEGRMVSVGDVQERVTKRMVAFGDVEEVFKRVTSAGGIFYKMQERQAETIAGQWSNLRDSIDIMFNEIGSSESGTIKILIATVKELYENWREVAFYLEPALYLLVSWKTVSALAAIGNSKLVTSLFRIERQTEATTKSLNRMQRAWKYARSAMMGFAAVAATFLVSKLIDMYREFTKAEREVKRLRESLSELVNVDTGRLDDLIDGLGDLMERYKLSNEGSKERRDIISTLNSTYGEYLDFVVKENTAYEQLEKTYENVIKRMKEKASLQTLEKGYQQISEKYAKELAEAREDFEDMLSGGFNVNGSVSKIDIDQKDIDNLYKISLQRIKETDLELLKDAKERKKIFQEIVKDYLGKDIYTARDYLEDLADAFIMKTEEEARLNKTIQTSYDAQVKSREAFLALQNRELEYEKKKADINKEANLTDFQRAEKLKEASKKYELDKIDIKLQFGEISEESARTAKDKIINWADDFTESFNKKIRERYKELSEEDLSKILISPEDQKAGISDTVKSTIDAWKAQKDIIEKLTIYKNAGLKIDEEALARAIKLEDLYRKRIEPLGIELGYVEKINEETLKYINAQVDDNYHLDLVDALKSVNELQEKYNKKKGETLKKLETINIQKQKGMDIDEKELANTYEQLITYDKILGLLGAKQGYAEKISKATFDSVNAKMGNEYQLDIVDSLKPIVDLQSKYNSKYEEALKLQESMNAQIARGVKVTKEDKKLVDDKVKNYDKLRKLLGYIDNDGRSKSQLTILKNQIELIKKAGQEYEKLLAYYNKGEAKDLIYSSFKDAFSESGLSIDMDFDISSVIKKIESLPNIAGKEGAKALKEAVAPLKAEVDLKPRKESLEEMGKEIENIISSYSLSFDLQKEGLDKDTISEMFNIDLFSVKDLKEKIDSMKPLFQNMGKEYQKVWEEAEKKVSKMQNDEIQERMKKYLSYIKHAYTERAAILIESQKQINEVKDLGFSEEKEDAIIRKIKKDRDKKMSEASWKEFQESDLYIKMFEDIESVSTRSIDYILEELGKLRESLKDQDPQTLKEIVGQMEKLQDIKISRNPFKGLVKDIKDFIKYQKESDELNKKFVDSSKSESSLKKELTQQELIVKAAEEKFLSIKKAKGEYSQEAVLAKHNLDRQKELLDVILKQLVAQGEITKELAEQIRYGEAAKNKTAERLAEISSAMNEISSMNLTENVEAIFGNISDKAKDALGSFQEIIGGISKMESGISSIMNGKVISGSVQVFTGLFDTIASVFRVGDKKKERAIQRQVKLVERLKETYENLKDAIDKAYAIDDLDKGTKNMNANLKERNKALEEAIAKEEDKKKTDHDRIKEWQKEIEANNKQIAENNKQLLSSVGGFGTDDRIKSAAEEFAQAWLDAYLEVGNGLDGLENKMNDWLKSSVQRQLLVNLSEQFITPILEQFDKMFKDESLGGTKLMPEEAAAWKDLYEKKSEQFNEAAKAYLEALKAAGIDLGSTPKGDELTGLQKGIQGITEQTAQALEAITESIRFFAADSNVQLKTLVNTLLNPPIENPFIYELRLQTEQLRMMNSLWGSLTKTKGGVSGKVLKVEIL